MRWRDCEHTMHMSYEEFGDFISFEERLPGRLECKLTKGALCTIDHCSDGYISDIRCSNERLTPERIVTENIANEG
jgi:hypothetical protein